VPGRLYSRLQLLHRGLIARAELLQAKPYTRSRSADASHCRADIVQVTLYLIDRLPYALEGALKWAKHAGSIEHGERAAEG
jgi:hypothetical protein